METDEPESDPAEKKDVIKLLPCRQAEPPGAGDPAEAAVGEPNEQPDLGRAARRLRQHDQAGQTDPDQEQDCQEDVLEERGYVEFNMCEI